MADAPEKHPIISRARVAQLIGDGYLIVIIDGMVVKADSWVKYHPGGDKAIMHMVGRDATDEVHAFHSVETRAKMKCFRIGYIDGPWKNFTPPIQGGVFPSSAASIGSPSSENVSNGHPKGIFDKPGTGDLQHQQSSTEPDNKFLDTELENLPAQKSDTEKSAHLDAYTKKEIELDLSQYPNLDSLTQQGIIDKYRALDIRMRQEGLYQCNYSAYGIEVCRYILLFSLAIFFLRQGWFTTSGAFIGMFWHQLVFTAHDAGHMGITHNFQIDTIIGILIADFLGGLSIGWWKRNHNIHHITTNSPEHDPDIEHMPFFMISPRFFQSLRSSYYERVMTYDSFAKRMARWQKYLYYPVMAFGRFNLYRLSWEFLILGLGPKKGPARWHRWLEITGQVFFWYWFGYLIVYRSIPSNTERVLFVLTSHMITAMLHVQITLSHFAMSTADLGVKESFPQRMLRTTMDVDCPEWLDFFHGGLQFQAIHHLFPRMPRHNLRRAQKLVQGFCAEAGIPYALYGFVSGNEQVIGRLAEVGRQAKILAECQEHVSGVGNHKMPVPVVG